MKKILYNYTKLKKHIEEKIIELENKTENIFNPNMMEDLESLLFQKTRLLYLKENYKEKKQNEQN
mgnify:CR=1 FL=1